MAADSHDTDFHVSVLSVLWCPDRHVVVSVRGELDMATGPQLAEFVRSLDPRGADVAFDLSGVRFVDCAGIASVRAAGDMNRQVSGRTTVPVIWRASPAVIRFLALADLEVLLMDGVSAEARVPVSIG
jgi:anti-anti-sigma factor